MKMIKCGGALFFFIGVLFFHVSFAQSRPSDTTQQNVNSSIARFASNEVQHVEIIQMPPRMMTRSRVTQSMLERSYHYSLSIRYIKQSPYGKGFQEAISSIGVTPSSEPADLRWAIILFDSEDHRVGVLYFDATGSRGAVDSTLVTFKGNMSEWLNDKFSNTFK